MNKLYPFLLTIFVLLGSQAMAATVKMGYFNLPPHMYSDSQGAAQGASVNFVNQIFTQMGYEVEWIGPMPYMRLLHYIEEANIDGMPLMQESEKEPLFYFPKYPYYRPQPVLIVKKSNPLTEIKSIADIKNYQVGFIAGVELSPFMKAHQDQLKIEYLSQQNWLELNLLKLKRGRIDAVYGLNQISTLSQGIKMGMQDEIKLLPLPEPPGEMFIGISKKASLGKQIIRDYNRYHVSFKVKYEDLLFQELMKDE
ncbi:transporter substrate-binding domain-containing protein [Motilimonas sp. KMU-193]|uniref:transporter substrate-binding domain-containing protein n=1 Tax=Motilimonas sp. KMU-193 TaxID=3388668 RepID=UPI00396B4247